MRSIVKSVNKSFIQWEDVDNVQLSRYIALTSDSKTIKDAKLTDYIPIPKSKTTLNSFTNLTKNSHVMNRDNQFSPPTKHPANKQIQSMLALGVAQCVKTVMENHFYTFRGVIRKQAKGGAIGAEITGEVSKVVMSLWDMKFLNLVKSLGILIDLYKRYVDDVIICPPINPGWWFCDKSKVMKFSRDLALSDMDSPITRTAKILNKIANTLEVDIQMTFDVPDNHSDGKMPVLDLKIWIKNNQVMYTFYKKEVSSKYTILKRSALSNSTKQNTLFMEALRRIQNNSINLPWDIMCGHLTEFAQTMQISGYSEYEQYNAIKGAIQRHREMMREIEDGKRSSLFRDKNEIMEAKKARMIWLNTWFLKGDTKGTVSCPTTLGGKLRDNQLCCEQRKE